MKKALWWRRTSAECFLALETASFIFGSCRCRVFAWVRCINEENNQLPTVHTGHCTVCSRIYHLVLLLNPIDRDLLFSVRRNTVYQLCQHLFPGTDQDG